MLNIQRPTLRKGNFDNRVIGETSLNFQAWTFFDDLRDFFMTQHKLVKARSVDKEVEHNFALANYYCHIRFGRERFNGPIGVNEDIRNT